VSNPDPGGPDEPSGLAGSRGRRRRERSGRSYDTSRLLALSDGVYAIAITLLVLDLNVPAGTTDAGLGDALRDLEPELYAYALTVLVLGAFWIGHHRLLADVPRVNDRILWINVLYLGLIALLPFPTDVLGSYGGQRSAVMLYAASVGVISLADTYLEFSLRRERLFVRADDGEPVELGPLLPPVGLVFLATVPIAWWNPRLATWLWLLAIPWPKVTKRIYAHRTGPIGDTDQ
jgi:uncharacterized membrane protein